MNILQSISDSRVFVSDGALGTQLFNGGLKPGECPDILCLENPELVSNIARAYFEAGSDIVSTNTFGASPFKLSDYGLESRAAEINRAAVKIVKSTTDGKALVAGSCGPSGKMLQPYGDASPEDIRISFLVQMTALIEAGADIIYLETFSDLQELLLALEAVRLVSPDIPVSAAMTFDATPRGFFTFMGVDIATAVTALEEAGADILGSNCGNGLDNMINIADQFRTLSSKPLLIQSNAGQPDSSSGSLIYDESPGFFKERISRLLDHRPGILGGCCGTTPEHIQVIRQAVDSYNKTDL